MIIDILMNHGIEQPYFTVNNAVNYVNCKYDNNATGLLQDANNSSLFLKLDHLTIISLGIVLPLNFSLWPNFENKPLQIEISLRQVITLNEISLLLCDLPFADYELSIGKFIELPYNIVNSFELLMKLKVKNGDNFQTISMINSPDILNNLVLPVTCFAKIGHNFPISNIP
jgi:hypothetical protein